MVFLQKFVAQRDFFLEDGTKGLKNEKKISSISDNYLPKAPPNEWTSPLFDVKRSLRIRPKDSFEYYLTHFNPPKMVR